MGTVYFCDRCNKECASRYVVKWGPSKTHRTIAVLNGHLCAQCIERMIRTSLDAKMIEDRWQPAGSEPPEAQEG